MGNESDRQRDALQKTQGKKQRHRQKNGKLLVKAALLLHTSWNTRWIYEYKSSLRKIASDSKTWAHNDAAAEGTVKRVKNENFIAIADEQER